MQKLYASLNPFKLLPFPSPITKSFGSAGLKTGITKQLGPKSTTFRNTVVGMACVFKQHRHYHKLSNNSRLSYHYPVNAGPVRKQLSPKINLKKLHTTQFVKVMFESTEQKENSDLDQFSHTAVMPREILMSLRPKDNQVRDSF